MHSETLIKSVIKKGMITVFCRFSFQLTSVVYSAVLVEISEVDDGSRGGNLMHSPD
jgi:hypothetical protein